MALQTFATPLPVSSRPFPSSRSRLLPPQASSFYLRCSPKTIAYQSTASWPSVSADAHRSGSCVWKAGAYSFGSCVWKAGAYCFGSCPRKVHAIEASASSSSTSCNNLDLLSRITLVLYRVLLVGGIGLSLGQVAAVYAAPAPRPSVSESLAKGSSNGNKKEVDEVKDSAGVLGDEFWRGLDLARGSDELILKQVLDRDPSNLPALECLAKTLMDVDNFPHALVVLEKLEGLQPNELEWKYIKADAYDLHGKSDLAKNIFEDILKVDPFSSRALQGLVLAMDQLDQSDSAMQLLVQTWNKAKQENNIAEARDFGMLIGQVHMFKGRMDEALQHYKNMINEDPRDFRPYLSQGIIYCVKGETEKADESFQTFESLCPEDLPGKEILDGMKTRARKEAQRICESRQKKKATAGQKGEKEKKKDDSGLQKWFFH